jgi:hypothetical protein
MTARRPGLGSRYLCQHARPASQHRLALARAQLQDSTSGWASNLFSLRSARRLLRMTSSAPAKTVIRGGFGTYRYQVSNDEAGNAMGGPQGSFNYSTGSANNGFYGYNIATANHSATVTLARHPQHSNRSSGPQSELAPRPSRPTTKATTRCPMRIPGASVWHRRCLRTPWRQPRMWAAQAATSLRTAPTDTSAMPTRFPTAPSSPDPVQTKTFAYNASTPANYRHFMA